MSDDITGFVLNENLESQLHAFSTVTAATKATAEAIAARAKEMAPIETGAYRDGIVVDVPGKSGVARVRATDSKSSWVEFGTARTSGHFTMRSAVESLGLTFKKKGA